MRILSSALPGLGPRRAESGAMSLSASRCISWMSLVVTVLAWSCACQLPQLRHWDTLDQDVERKTFASHRLMSQLREVLVHHLWQQVAEMVSSRSQRSCPIARRVLGLIEPMEGQLVLPCVACSGQGIPCTASETESRRYHPPRLRMKCFTERGVSTCTPMRPGKGSLFDR